MIRAFAIPVALLLVSATGSTQLRNASPNTLKAFTISEGTVQQLVVPANARKPFSVRVVLGNKLRVLSMRPHSVLSPDFKLVTDDGAKLTTIPTPAEVTYQGEVLGEPGSSVAGSLLSGQFAALVIVDGNEWSMQPLTDMLARAPLNEHIVYEHKHLLKDNTQCGHTDAHRPPEQQRGGNASPQAGVMKECEIALDCNNYYYKRFGSNSTTTFNAATSRINMVDAIYRREVEICYNIPTIIIRTTQVYLNGPQVGCVSGPDLLEELRTRWRTYHTSVRRDVTHMLSGWGSWSGIIGCAYLSVICSTTNGYGVSRVVHSTQGRNTGLVAHELGHNWSSGHCNSSPPCYIMCSGIGGCNNNLTAFGTFAKNKIIPYKNGRSCLSDCCPAASYTYFGAGCKGTGPNGGVVLLDSLTGPKLGYTMNVRVTNARPNALAIMMHNIYAASIDLTSAGAAGCFLYAQNMFHASAVVTNFGGAGFFSLTIPNITALCGLRFYDQILVDDSKANRLGLVLTRRGQPIIGS